MSEPYIRVTGVERSFGDGQRVVHVLRGVQLEVGAGQLVALFGPSGSGKRRCSTCSARWTCQIAARLRWAGSRSPA